ncbi:hypothetical protein D3C84_642310 [compost metagenome]
MDLHGRHPKAWQQGEQAALGEILSNFPLGLQGDPLPRQGKLAQGQHVVALHPGFAPHPVLAPSLVKEQQAAPQHVAAEPVVRGQICRGARRPLARQVGGGGAQQHPGLAQLAGHQGGVRQGADPQRHVDALGNEIPLLVVGDDLDAEARMGLQQGRQGQRQRLARHPHGGGDPHLPEQAVAHFREAQLGLVEGLLQGLAPLPHHLPRLGQTEATGGAMQQGEAEQALQLADVLADGGGGHAEGLGGPRHGARLHHGGEDGVTSELIHY